MNETRDIVSYLAQTVQLGGSDLHLSAGAPPAARVGEQLTPLEDFLLDQESVENLIQQTLSESQRAVLEETWELDYAVHVDQVGRFRGNVHMVRGHSEAAFRYVPQQIPDLAQLGHYLSTENFCQLRRGLVLVTGVTGSGKTTTLAAMVQRISEIRSGVIITIEDPVEFLFSHKSCLVKQRELGTDTKSFPVALRQAMRQDPDVIVVSELRDLETIRVALTAAETGHLVLATLHTLDAPQTIDRIVDVFPADQQQQVVTQLSGVLQGIVSQRLISRADGRGRVLASEVLCASHALRTCIRERKIEQIVGLMEIGYREGNRTIDLSIVDLLLAGTISPDEAFYHCRDRKVLESALNTAAKAAKQP